MRRDEVMEAANSTNPAATSTMPGSIQSPEAAFTDLCVRAQLEVTRLQDGNGQLQQQVRPLSINLLRDIRSFLVQFGQKQRQGRAGVRVQKIEDTRVELVSERASQPHIVGITASITTISPDAPANTQSQSTSDLFNLVIQTSRLPSLSTVHRTAAIDVLSTWLIRASTTSIFNPSLTMPFTHSPGATLLIFQSLLHLLVEHYSSPSTTNPLQKSLKDLFSAMISTSPRIFTLTVDSEGYFWGWVIGLIIEKLKATEGVSSTGQGDPARKKVLFYMIDSLLSSSGATSNTSFGEVVTASEFLRRFDGPEENLRAEQQQDNTGSALVAHLLTSAALDRTLAPSAGKALISLLAAALMDLKKLRGEETDVQNQWYSLWASPLRQMMTLECTDESENLEDDEDSMTSIAFSARANLTTYVLPGLFKLAGASELRKYLGELGADLSAQGTVLIAQPFSRKSTEIQEGAQTTRINITEKGQLHNVDAWLSCLRVGCQLGFAEIVSSNDPQSSSNVLHIPSTILPSFLSHPSSNTRLSAFTLLTTSPLTTSPLPAATIELLRGHIPYLHLSTDPEFRNQFCSLIRALIERLAASSFAASRKAQKLRALLERGKGVSSDAEELRKLEAIVDDTHDFVKWYLSFLAGEIIPGKGYPRTVVALRVIHMWIRSGIDSASHEYLTQVPSPSATIAKGSSISKSHSQAPTDIQKGKGDQSNGRIVGPHGNEVQFPFKITIFSTSQADVVKDEHDKKAVILSHHLLNSLFNSYADVRSSAAELVKIGLIPSPSGAGKTLLTNSFIDRCFTRVQKSGRARDADGLARVLDTVYEGVVRWREFTIVDYLAAEAEDGWGTERRARTFTTGLEYVTWLVNLITHFLKQVKPDEASVEELKHGCAIHGVLAGLKQIFERKDIYEEQISSKKDSAAITPWRDLYSTMILQCEQIWERVETVLCKCVPEGYVSTGEGDGDGAIEDESPAPGGDLTTQTLLFYSWRSIKESSELLSTFTTRAPYNVSITGSDIERVGTLLLSQLANLRHRGAFLAVFPCFVQVCKRCFQAEEKMYQDLPRKWLMENFSLIVRKAGLVTRRSAGIPFLIVGILTAEMDPSRSLLKEAFGTFVEIARMDVAQTDTAVGGNNKASTDGGDDGGGGTKIDLPQVHALNCIKLLFTDTRLGGVVTELMGTALEVAVGSFGSPIWAIRNGGLMLYTALLNRLFGTRKSRNDYSFTETLFTTEGFFERYPSIRKVLLSHLRTGVKGIASTTSRVAVEMVYPALSLISRLGVSPGYVGMDEFKPLIVECMKSRIWKVREVAAKAYATLIAPEECMSELSRLLQSERGQRKQNILHGDLCAVKNLVERRVGQVSREGEQGGIEIIRAISETLNREFGRLVQGNPCLVTKTLYLQLMEMVAVDPKGVFAGNMGVVSADSRRRLRTVTAPLLSTLATLATQEIILSTQPTGSNFVGNAAYRSLLARILTHPVCAPYNPRRQEEILSLLEGPDDEVILSILLSLIENPASLSDFTPENMLSLHKLLWRKAIHDTIWTEISVAALELFNIVPTWPYSAAKKCQLLAQRVEWPVSVPHKEAALRCLGKYICVMLQEPEEEVSSAEKERILRWWLSEVTKASRDDMSYSTRESALQSLSNLSPLLSTPTSLLLPIYSLIYDFLNDDDPDLRSFASSIVTKYILNTPLPMVPSAVAARLASSLGEVFGKGIVGVAVGKIIGCGDGEHGDEVGVDVKGLVERAIKDSHILFSREKQNLWLDELREVEIWEDVIVKTLQNYHHPLPSIDPKDLEAVDQAMERLTRFVQDGADALGKYVFAKTAEDGSGGDRVKAGDDGPLGWATIAEEIFILAWRVGGAYRVLRVWERIGEAEELVEEKKRGANEVRQVLRQAKWLVDMLEMLEI